MQADWLNLPAINAFQFDSVDFMDDFAAVTWSPSKTWINNWTDVLNNEEKVCLYIEKIVLFQDSSDDFDYSNPCSGGVLCSCSVFVTCKCACERELYLVCHVTEDVVKVWVWDPGENQ